MKENTDQKKDGLDRLSDKKKYIIILFLSIFLVCNLFFIYSYFDNYLTEKNSDIVIDENLVISSDTSNGFPLTFTSNDIIDVECVSSKMMILTKNLLTSVTTTGKIKYLSSFTYVEPTMISGDKYGIVYDTASAKYMLFNKNKVLFNGETPDKSYIITATINNDGTYALVTKSNDSACNVSVYDKTGEAVYIWKCSDEYIVSCDISDDGENIVCSGIGANNGVIYTKVYHLNIHEDKQLNEYKIDGSAVVDTKLSGNDKVIVSCDNSRQIIDLYEENYTPNIVKYTSQALACDSDENGYTAVFNNKFGSFDKMQVTVYDKKNKVVYKSELTCDAYDIICKGKRVYILTENSIMQAYNGNSELLITTQANGKGLVVCENKLYYYSQGSLYTGK